MVARDKRNKESQRDMLSERATIYSSELNGVTKLTYCNLHGGGKTSLLFALKTSRSIK